MIRTVVDGSDWGLTCDAPGARLWPAAGALGRRSDIFAAAGIDNWRPGRVVTISLNAVPYLWQVVKVTK